MTRYILLAILLVTLTTSCRGAPVEQRRVGSAGPVSLPASYLTGAGAGDLGGTWPSPTVTNAQGGTLGFGSATGTITGSAAATAVGMAQTTPGSVAIPNNMTFTTQAPNGGSGSAAQNTPGSFVVNLPVVGTVGTTGADPYLTTEYGGTPVVWQGPFAGLGAGVGAIYFAGNNPSTAVQNYGVLGSSAYTILNAPSGGTLYFGIGGAAVFTSEFMTTSGIQMFNGQTADLGGGVGVLGIGVVTTAPSTSPNTGNSVIWSDTLGVHDWHHVSGTVGLDYMLAPQQIGTNTGQQNKRRLYSGLAQTTSTTAVNAFQVPLATSSTNVDIQIRAVGRLHGGITSVSQTTDCLYENTAGTVQAATVTGISIAASHDTAYATAGVTCTVTGTNVNVNVTGVAATTIDWTVFADAIVN